MAKKLNNNTILKGLLYFHATYHILIGIIILLSTKTAQSIANLAFNFNLELTTQIGWIVRPFAAYLLVFGAFQWIAARDPLKYRPIVYATAGFMGLRVIQRIIFLFQGGDLAVNQNPVTAVISIIIVASLGGSFFFLAKRLK